MNQSPQSPPEFADRFRVLGANQLEAATDGVILGGRELPLILRHGTASGIPRLDTTQIHAKALVARAWS